MWCRLTKAFAQTRTAAAPVLPMRLPVLVCAVTNVTNMTDVFKMQRVQSSQQAECRVHRMFCKEGLPGYGELQECCFAMDSRYIPDIDTLCCSRYPRKLGCEMSSTWCTQSTAQACCLSSHAHRCMHIVSCTAYACVTETMPCERNCERLRAYQDGGLPLELQVVVQAQDLPVGGDSHHHLLARSHDQLSRRRIYVASCQGHYMHTCTSAPILGLGMHHRISCISIAHAQASTIPVREMRSVSYTHGNAMDATFLQPGCRRSC